MELNEQVTAGPNHYRYCAVKNVGVCDARWTCGFWAERFDMCRNRTIPSMWEALNDPENGAVFSNFYVAAGLQKGKHLGTDWSDGDCYKWMEAVAHLYGVTRDPELERTLDELIGVIGRAQEPDGYICTQIQLTDRGRWERRRHHELYNMGHLMTAASAHYRVTGKKSFLDIARKVGDYLYAVFQPRPRHLVHYGWNPAQIMGLVDLYRATADTRYLDLAVTFIDMRGSAPEDFMAKGDWVLWDGGDQNQDRVPLREETEAVGHAVTATYLYSGATDVYAETGEKALLDALMRIWDDVIFHKMYITGGVGALHAGVSKRGDPVHEAFGLQYQLPNATAYCETCANIGFAMWNHRLLQITGEAKYADVLECALYNSVLSSISLDGTRFFYTNPLRWYGNKHQLLSSDAYERWRTFHCYCCPPNVARTIAGLHRWIYGLSDGAVWVHLYGSSRLDTTLPDGAPLRLVQETEYPWDGAVRITFEEVPNEPLTMRLRIPGWARRATIRVNGRDVGVPTEPGTYTVLRRRWLAGDVVELELPMDIRLIVANPRVEETRNQVAILRGPVVYCLESVDLGEGVDIAEVHIPRDIQLVPRRAPELLGGITVLEGHAYRIRQPNWHSRLYSEIDSYSVQKVPIRLIPYYAWNNRGSAEMTVWIPLCC